MDGGVNLLQTVRKGNGHKHIVYTNDKTGQGFTSVSKGHSHPVTFEVDKKISNTGEPIPIGTGRWDIGIADGHTHEVTPIVVMETKKKESDETVVSDCLQLYRYSRDLEKPSRTQGRESLKFYQGEQWEDEIKSQLQKEMRACLTINQIESKLDLLSGYQRQNRTDIKYMPVEDGDQRVSEILDIVTKNILENCNYRFEETEVFEDGTIVGRGLFNIYVDFSKNIQGDIIVEKFEWDDCYLGPHAKKDCSDLEYLVKTKWYSRAKLAEMYPDKIKEIFNEFEEETDEVSHEPVGDAYAHSDNKLSIVADPDLIDLEKKSIKVLETWRKEYKRSYVVVDIESDFYYNASDWPKEDISALESIPPITVIPRVVHQMRVTKTAGEVLLEDSYPDLAMQDFQIVTFYAKKRGDMFWGKVHSVKDPQREINKRHSQLTDIMNRQAAYGWFYDDTTFPTPAEVNNFKKNSSTPGFTQRVNSVKSLPEKVEGAKVPTEIINLLQIESQSLREVLNINLEMEGASSNAQSGIAILERKKQGLVGNEFLFDNFSIAKVKIGRMLVAMIQKYYSAERILKILQNEAMKAPVQIGGVPAEQLDMAEIKKLLENTDLTKQDVVVSESGWSPTTRMANFTMWAELAGKGAPVPMPFLIELSDLPEKDKMLQMFAQESEARQKEKDDKNQVEVIKTQIAADAKTQGKVNQGG